MVWHWCTPPHTHAACSCRGQGQAGQTAHTAAHTQWHTERIKRSLQVTTYATTLPSSIRASLAVPHLLYQWYHQWRQCPQMPGVPLMHWLCWSWSGLLQAIPTQAAEQCDRLDRELSLCHCLLLPCSSFVPHPVTPLHKVDAQIKQVHWASEAQVSSAAG